MINRKKMICLFTMMLVIFGLSTFAAATEPCYPQTPFDLYALNYIGRTNTAVLQDPGIHVIMAGTGSPWFDPIRSPQCIGIVAGGQFLLFDVGDSAAKTLDSMNLPVNMATNVFTLYYLNIFVPRSTTDRVPRISKPVGKHRPLSLGHADHIVDLIGK